MHIDVEHSENHAVLHLRGEFDTYYVSHLQDEIEALVDSGVVHVVLNLRLVKVLNSTALRCTPAPVHSDGLGTLTVSMDNRTFSPNASAPIRFFPLFSIAVGRRPYLSETEGTILLDPGGQGGARSEPARPPQRKFPSFWELMFRP